MKTLLSLFFCSLLSCFLIIDVTFSAELHPAASSSIPTHLPGELIIKFHEGIPNIQVEKTLTKLNAQKIKKFRLTGALHVKIPSTDNIKDIISLLKENSEIEYVEPNYLRHLNRMPNDEMILDLWGLHNVGQTGGTFNADIDAPEAWDITTGNPEMVVALIDSGVDMTHGDLAPNIWINPDEIPDNGIDDDNNGYIDDVNGWDFANDDNDPSDTDAVCGGHGTHTAGTIGAVGDNSIGITGINWDVKLMPLKIFRKYLLFFCSTSSADIIEAIDYAALMGVRVSNNSYGGPDFSQAEFDAIRASNNVFVAAAGNEGTNNDTTPSFPANYDLHNIISVAATDHNDNLTSFSNYGSSVELAAPGASILSTTPDDTYSFFDGTSMAAPHVTGAVALVMGLSPDLTNNEVIWNILNSTDDLALPVFTGGRLNVSNALNVPSPDVIIDIIPEGAQVVNPGEIIHYTVTLENTATTPKQVNVSLLAVLPNGKEHPLLNVTRIMAGEEIISRNFSQQIPVALYPGNYVLVGRAEVLSQSYDEDRENYTIQ